MGRRLFLRRGRGLTVTLFIVICLAGGIPNRLPLQTPSVAYAGEGTGAVRAVTVAHGTGTLSLADLEDRFAALAAELAPSVVAISAAIDPTDSDDALRSEELTTDKLGRFLNRSTRTVGTGFVVDPDGYIVTNEHVVGEAVQIWVTTDDRRVYPAIVIGSDPRSDLAVLKIPASGLRPVSFADPTSLRRGQWAIALGNPYGMAAEGELAMSVGIVSAIDRALPKLSSKENRLYDNLIQTTAEINPGNSGGPLFDLSGRVIGINTAVILPQKSTNGIGFAIPATPHVLGLIEDLKRGHEVVYGYLGVLVSTPTARDRRESGLAQTAGGARVDSIEPASPATECDLRVGDLVTSVDGRAVRDSEHFIAMIGQASVETPSVLSVHRGRERLSLEVMPRRRPMPSVAVTRQNQRIRWRGLVLAPLPPHFTAAITGGESGLMVVSVDERSPFAGQVSMGTIVTSVAGQAIASITELQTLIDQTPPEQWEIETKSAPAAMAAGDMQ